MECGRLLKFVSGLPAGEVKRSHSTTRMAAFPALLHGSGGEQDLSASSGCARPHMLPQYSRALATPAADCPLLALLSDMEDIKQRRHTRTRQ